MLGALKTALLALLSVLGLYACRNFGPSFMKRLWAKGNAVDRTDCYFDKECHAKVDWDKVTESKKVFFEKLKILKGTKDTTEVQHFLTGMHERFASAGMPEDRVDYMMTKWLESMYPEALEAKSSIIVSGFTCDNGYGQDINQKYMYQGLSKDGRPFYRGATNPDHYIYYDKYCADDTREPRWLLGQKPDVTREFDLNVNDSPGCNNDFSIVTDSKHLPGGFQKLAWNWCGDHGLHDSETVSITYVLPKDDRLTPEQKPLSKDGKFASEDQFVSAKKRTSPPVQAVIV